MFPRIVHLPCICPVQPSVCEIMLDAHVDRQCLLIDRNLSSHEMGCSLSSRVFRGVLENFKPQPPRQQTLVSNGLCVASTRLLLHRVEQALSSLDTKICGKEQRLQLVEQIAVDLAARQHGRQSTDKGLLGSREHGRLWVISQFFAVSG